MSVEFPIFVFEKDDQSMRLIERFQQISYHLEAIDIENDEYVFWDNKGMGVQVSVVKNRVTGVSSCNPVFSLQKALASYAESLGIEVPVERQTPIEIWHRIETEKLRRRKK